MFFKWKGRWALLTAFFCSLVFAQERLALCAACHGEDGNSANPQIPSIAGQPKLFLENQLILFREELRRSDQMLPVVKGLKDPEVVKLAEHSAFSSGQNTPSITISPVIDAFRPTLPWIAGAAR